MKLTANQKQSIHNQRLEGKSYRAIAKAVGCSKSVVEMVLGGDALREKTRVRNKAYRESNKERLAVKQKETRSSKPEVIAARNRTWNENNRDHRAEYVRRKRREDLQYAIGGTLRVRVADALRAASAGKTRSTLELIGCSVEDLMSHLESKFVPGMTWENRGLYGWHIDHIQPCASFDLTDINQQKQCFHFSNLQPLWAEDNRRKGAQVT